MKKKNNTKLLKKRMLCQENMLLFHDAIKTFLYLTTNPSKLRKHDKNIFSARVTTLLLHHNFNNFKQLRYKATKTFNSHCITYFHITYQNETTKFLT